MSRTVTKSPTVKRLPCDEDIGVGVGDGIGIGVGTGVGEGVGVGVGSGGKVVDVVAVVAQAARYGREPSKSSWTQAQQQDESTQRPVPGQFAASPQGHRYAEPPVESAVPTGHMGTNCVAAK